MPSQNSIANYCLWSKWALITQRMTSFDYSKNDISLVPSLYGYGILKYFSKSRDFFTNSEKIKLSPVVIQFIKQVGNWRELLLSISQLEQGSIDFEKWKYILGHLGVPLPSKIFFSFLFFLTSPPTQDYLDVILSKPKKATEDLEAPLNSYLSHTFYIKC